MNLTADESASRSMPLEIEPITRAPSSAVQTEPAAAEQARARDHRTGDRQQQQVAAAGVLVDREQARGGEDAADRRHRAGDAEDGDPDAVDADARPPRRLGVAADGEDVAAEGGALDDVLHADHEAEQDQHRERHAAVGVEDRRSTTIVITATSAITNDQRRALAGRPWATRLR